MLVFNDDLPIPEPGHGAAAATGSRYGAASAGASWKILALCDPCAVAEPIEGDADNGDAGEEEEEEEEEGRQFITHTTCS